MDPAITFCPNLVCPARGQTGQGNIRIHSCRDQRFLCTECHKTFSATKGTALYRLRTPAETVSLVVTLMAHGCPLQAIVVAFGYDERTVACWLARAGSQGQAVQEHLVEHPRDLGQVQADEIRVKKQGGIVWMALAMMVCTRLWLAGEVSERRDMELIRRLIARVRRCALSRPLLFCTDGLCSYVRAIRETFRDPVRGGALGDESVLLPQPQHIGTHQAHQAPASHAQQEAVQVRPGRPVSLTGLAEGRSCHQEWKGPTAHQGNGSSQMEDPQYDGHTHHGFLRMVKEN
jgi:transposase-like protein